MGDYLGKVFSQMRDFFNRLTPGRKVALLGLALAIVGATISLFYWAGTPNYIPLMTNLNAEDSTNIIRILREKHIPFKVDPTGKNISIPPDSLYELRLELATMGLPQSSVVGYELFDKQSFGTTSFVQKLNQKRAQEGELTRTINTMKGVRRSRVHLAIPNKSAFVEDQKRTTASVVLDLEPGVVLSEKQVYGIGNLVSRAIEGLDLNDVVIMNSDGKVLSKNQNDPLASATASQLEYKEKVQGDLEHRVETMLGRIVGEGHVSAKVTADIDFSQVSETQTIYDADGAAVISVEKRNDNMSGSRPGPYGVAGNVANAPGQPPATNGEVKTETSKNNEVTNYKVPETVRRTAHSIGTVKKMAVAVVIDAKRVKKKDKDGKFVTSIEAWPPEKLKEFEQIVSTAVGLDSKRGDTLEIKSMEFTVEDFEEAQRLIEQKEYRSMIQNLVIAGIAIVLFLLFFFFVVKPFIKWITDNTVANVETMLPQTLEELERIQKGPLIPILEEAIPVLPESVDPAKVQGEMIKEKIVTLVDANPHKAALILKDWLHGEAKKRNAEKVDDKNKGKDKAATA